VSGEERQHKNAEQGSRDVPKALHFSNKWDEKVAAGGKSTIDPTRGLWRSERGGQKEIPSQAEWA
jgi:hypothetical protein